MSALPAVTAAKACIWQLLWVPGAIRVYHPCADVAAVHHRFTYVSDTAGGAVH